MMRIMLCAVTVMAVGICGCSGRMTDKWRQIMPRVYKAGGVVQFQGKPLRDATVVFHPRGGTTSSARTAAAVTNVSGRFVLTTLKARDGAAAGPYAVTIHKVQLLTLDGKVPKPNELGDILEPTVEKPLIPEKYFAPETSGLTAEIKPSGRNDFSFSLE